jgi:hypothetical protein
MAAWIKPFLLALLAALCAHVLGLAGIGSQMKVASSVLAAQTDPLFTRTIEAASAPAAPAPIAPQAAPAAIKSRAATQILAAPQSIPADPTPTVAQSQTESWALSPTTTALLTPTDTLSDTVGDILLTPAKPEGSEIIAPTLANTNTPTSTASQTLSSQPSGSTDSLLTTGQWPADTRVSYVMTGFFNGELHGKGEVQWTRSGLAADRYQVRVTVDAGLMEMRITSQGRVSAQGLLPEAFEESVKVLGRSPRVRPLKLEAAELVLGDGRRIPRPAKEPMAVQDSVSQFIDLGHRFQEGRAKLETGQVIRIWLGRPGGLDEWIFDVGASETLTLPRIGEVIVFPLKPRPVVNARGTITLSMWLAPSLQYLPAKIRIDVNDKTHVELTAERLEQR